MKQSEVSKEAWEFYAKVGDVIAREKRQIISVKGGKHHFDFVYTIGNQEKNLPELLLIGDRSDHAVRLLILLSDKMIEQKGPFEDEEIVQVTSGLSVKLIDAKDPIAKMEYTVQAGIFYKCEDYKVQQVVVPDAAGKWPEEAECHADYKVPLLRNAIVMPEAS